MCKPNQLNTRWQLILASYRQSKVGGSNVQQLQYYQIRKSHEIKVSLKKKLKGGCRVCLPKTPRQRVPQLPEDLKQQSSS